MRTKTFISGDFLAALSSRPEDREGPWWMTSFVASKKKLEPSRSSIKLIQWLRILWWGKPFPSNESYLKATQKSNKPLSVIHDPSSQQPWTKVYMSRITNERVCFILISLYQVQKIYHVEIRKHRFERVFGHCWANPACSSQKNVCLYYKTKRFTNLNI